MAHSCPYCGAVVRPGATFCGTCGQSITPPSALVPGGTMPSAYVLWADDGRQFFLTTPVTRIGRDSTSDVHLADNRVSGRQAELQEEAAGYVLRDVGSRNGTYVNGQRITSDCLLSEGDEILVGSTRLTFGRTPTPGGQAGLTPSTQGMDPADVQAILAAGGQAIAHHPGQSPAWPGSGQMVPPPPTPPVPPQGTPTGFWGRLVGPKAIGAIPFEPKEAPEQPPKDIARTMVMVAVVIAFLGILAVVVPTILAGAALLACLGGAALLVVVPVLFMLLKAPFSLLINWLRDDQPVTVVRFRVEDEISGRPVDIVLMRKMGEGSGIFQGDRVQVWGRFKGNVLYASRAQMERTKAIVYARKPWPLWIGLLALGSVVAGLVYLAVVLDLIHL